MDKPERAWKQWKGMGKTKEGLFPFAFFGCLFVSLNSWVSFGWFLPVIPHIHHVGELRRSEKHIYAYSPQSDLQNFESWGDERGRDDTL